MLAAKGEASQSRALKRTLMQDVRYNQFMESKYICPVCKSNQLVIGYTYRNQFRVAAIWGMTLVALALTIGLLVYWVARCLTDQPNHWAIFGIQGGILGGMTPILFPRIGAMVSPRDFFWRCRSCKEKRPLTNLESAKALESEPATK